MCTVPEMMQRMAPRRGRARRDLSDHHERVQLRGRVPESVKARAEANAEAAGISTAWYLEMLVMRDPVDEAGCPVWLKDAHLRGRSRRGAADGQEELPLKSA